MSRTRVKRLRDGRVPHRLPRHALSIQSVSKPLVSALVCDALGAAEVAGRLGVDATGLPFNSVMAVELHAERTTNPLVNSGAIATTSLMPGGTAVEQWNNVRDVCRASRAERSTGRARIRIGSRHQLTPCGHRAPVAQLRTCLLRSRCRPDLYTKQCSLLITARDLAVMGATLAGGGVNPVTSERVVSAGTCRRVLAVMATAGLYENSGEWLYDVGLPGKSGVSGGVVTVAPGKGALATFSPPLDEAGNSVRGRFVTRFLSERLGLNLFASVPIVQGSAPSRAP